MKYLLLPLCFSLCVFFILKWVSCRQHIYGSYFLIQNIQLPYVFLLEHLSHLYLRVLFFKVSSIYLFLITSLLFNYSCVHFLPTTPPHLPVRVLLMKADSSAEWDLHRVWWHRIQRLRLLHFLRLILYGGECYTQEIWHLWYRRGTRHRDLVAIPSAFSPEPQTPVCPPVTIPLCLPFSWAYHEWLWKRFCALRWYLFL